MTQIQVTEEEQASTEVAASAAAVAVGADSVVAAAAVVAAAVVVVAEVGYGAVAGVDEPSLRAVMTERQWTPTNQGNERC